MSKQIVQNAVVTKSEPVNAVAVSELITASGIETSDLTIPALLLMQNTSEYVGDGKAVLGDIVNSQSLEVIGGLKADVEVVPLKMYKTWRIYNMAGSNPKFMRAEEFTAKNAGLEWQFTDNGVPCKRVLNMNFYVLIKKELDAGEGFPALIAFKSTSLNAGKALATAMYKQAILERPVYGKSVMLSIKKEKKDTNTFAVYEIRTGSVTSETHKSEAAKWVSILNTTSHTVDDSSEKEATQTSNFKPTSVSSSDEIVERF